MWDGHTALEQKIAKGPVKQDGFSLCLTYAHLADGRKCFVVHIASEEPFSGEERKWLGLMGLQEFPACPHLDQRPCFWKVVKEMKSQGHPWEHFDLVHHAFDQLCRHFPEAIRKLKEASEILGGIGLTL